MAKEPVFASEGRDRVLQTARELAPDFSARAPEGEALRTMPSDLVARVKDGGLFRLALPRSLGGLELDPLTIVEVVELLSEADGSAGWTVLIGNSTTFFAWLEPSVARSMIGNNSGFCSTSMFAPMGHARPEGKGMFSVTGRWPFNSGCLHSEWLQVGVFVMDGEAPRRRDEFNPDWRFAFVPHDAAQIEDLGRAGTSGHREPPSELGGNPRPRRPPRRTDIRTGPPRRTAVATRTVRPGIDLHGRVPAGRRSPGH